jgi:hypothetical protein
MGTKRAGYEAVSSYLEENFGLTDSILSLDTTDPAKGFTLQEAIQQIDSLKLANTPAGYAKAANILAKTNWFKTNGVEITKRLAAEKSSPGNFKRFVTDTAMDIKAQANALGFDLDDAEVTAIARDAYIYGNAYNSTKVVQKIVGAGDITGGQAMNAVDALKAHSADMGVAYDDKWYTDAARNIAENKATADDWKRTINDVAKSKYAAFADQIDAGQTVKQVASPYINSMSQILELPSDSINLKDPTINKALTSLSADSKPALQPLWEFETSLRKDPRWTKTKNARDTLDAGARQILSDFGLVS